MKSLITFSKQEEKSGQLEQIIIGSETVSNKNLKKIKTVIDNLGEKLFNDYSWPVRAITKTSAGFVLPGDIQEQVTKKYNLPSRSLTKYSIMGGVLGGGAKMGLGLFLRKYNPLILSDVAIDIFGILCARSAYRDVKENFQNKQKILRNLNRLIICSAALYLDAETFYNFWGFEPQQASDITRSFLSGGASVLGLASLTESAIRGTYLLISKKPIGGIIFGLEIPYQASKKGKQIYCWTSDKMKGLRELYKNFKIGE